MHSTDGVTKGITFHHNGDYSGEVWIVIRDSTTWEYKHDDIYEHSPELPEFGAEGYHLLRIPFEDLKRLVAHYVYREKISRMEELNDDDAILGIPSG